MQTSGSVGGLLYREEQSQAFSSNKTKQYVTYYHASERVVQPVPQTYIY